MEKIDSHLHLIFPERLRYPWLSGVPALDGRAFTLEDYREAAEGTGITGTVFVEVDVHPDDAADEARQVCRLSEDPSNRILGVVAAAFPESPDFHAQLDAIAHPALKGIRRVLHTQDDSLSRDSDFRKHVASLGPRGLSFDMCVLARQLPVAIELADACPETRLLLDHCGVPDIAGGGFEPWADSLRQLADRPNVTCKLSGIVAYAGPGNATPAALGPWVNHALDCFGPGRLIWGGDWPVCNLGSTLGGWASVSESLLAALSSGEKHAIFSDNAKTIYRL